MLNDLITKLAQTHRLELEEYRLLMDRRDPESADRLASLARQTARQVYGNRVFVRGLVEISNICKNDCLYCGIRRGNRACDRYRLTREQILNEVWGYSYIGETNVVDVYIRYLRSKIDEAFGKKYILTIRGVGYYVKEE